MDTRIRSQRLAGKVALVIGSGIGRGCALMFARHGARVMNCDLDAAKAEAGLALTRPAGVERLVANSDGTRARGASAGGVTDSPKCIRMARIVAGSVVNAISFISVPHCGKVSGKQLKIRPISQAQSDDAWWRGGGITAARSSASISTPACTENPPPLSQFFRSATVSGTRQL